MLGRSQICQIKKPEAPRSQSLLPVTYTPLAKQYKCLQCESGDSALRCQRFCAIEGVARKLYCKTSRSICTARIRAAKQRKCTHGSGRTHHQIKSQQRFHASTLLTFCPLAIDLGQALHSPRNDHNCCIPCPLATIPSLKATTIDLKSRGLMHRLCISPQPPERHC